MKRLLMKNKYEKGREDIGSESKEKMRGSEERSDEKIRG